VQSPRRHCDGQILTGAHHQVHLRARPQPEVSQQQRQPARSYEKGEEGPLPRLVLGLHLSAHCPKRPGVSLAVFK